MLKKLEPEKHDGPIEYKLHLLLRWRRTFTYSSTTMPAWANQQGRIESASAASPSITEAATARSMYQPSTQNRQARLQQLTTQLLWRLQQSSPFHSSSNAELVLPVLPEATPRLGPPERPSKLLPGLEESQGALYEIGVADDGTLVGLADEELEESLINLRAMAASLGCVVDVHRRVIVGDCEWVEIGTNEEAPIARCSKLWVAEVLVRPDNKSIEVVPASTEDALPTLELEAELNNHHPGLGGHRKEYLRIALIGASAAGKSSLLGTLTTSVLDNGRGKSRLSLLKHRHEIASGITSSVAQELLGYQTRSLPGPFVINYATGNVSSWPDIHNLASRMIFLSDSPGLPRYSKSTFRALISWNPAWTMLCIPADEHIQDDLQGTTASAEPNLSMAHLALCLKLGKPLVITITKMDVATKAGLREVLGHILSAVKAAGRIPTLVNAPSQQAMRVEDIDFSVLVNEMMKTEIQNVEQKLSRFDHGGYADSVPIVMTSAVSGSGIASLHSLLRALPEMVPALHEEEGRSAVERVVFRSDEVFAIPPSKVYSSTIERSATDGGVVLCGILNSGTISLGDELVLGPFSIEEETKESLPVRATRRASSHQGKYSSNSIPRSFSENFSRSLQLDGVQDVHDRENNSTYVTVRVVSLRNLRLPVSSLHVGDTGTVGVQPSEGARSSSIPLEKARKGMILTHPVVGPQAYSGFTAVFPHSDFGTLSSPPLILGGHAIAYIHSVRAAVKAVAVALDDVNREEETAVPRQSTAHAEVFSFDDYDEQEDEEQRNGTQGSYADLRISFKFVSTVEFLEMDDQVMIIPNMTPAGPIAGPAPTFTVPGFSGFVGRICAL